ncbi:hypothetical protein [Runella aurantiaca]|uniref:Uncharacterized protein n=1 Tax=Runella aurantiaca TaxID=2282308 RepID=A0A369I4D5_9BACT|nr:hypothetical protein [Runella aurantiaca]RDB03115.1 hypothetical protein DVG78_25475 [Runella aurantiaca]
MTSFQYITDKKGRKKAVIIPIKEWEMYKKVLNLEEEGEEDTPPVFTKAEVLANLKEAVEEVKLYRQGKIQLQTAEEFLEELKQEGYL